MRRLPWTLALALLALAIAPAFGQDELGVAGALDDPEGRVASQLREALRRAHRGGPSARLTFWGASHTASDQYTSVIRTRLRARFGDAGSGLVMPAQPFSLYDMRDFEVPHRAMFEGRFIRGRHRIPGRYGRAGMALEVEAAGSSVLVPRSGTRVAHVELWAEARAGGGTLHLEVGSESVSLPTSLSGGATEGATLVAALDVPAAAHRIRVRADGDGPARIFGVLSESDQHGVIVEAFGVPGARARDQLPWDAATFAEQVAMRTPDLVAMAYGTNESGDGTPLAEVEADVNLALTRLHEAAPTAACLVIGPSDRPRRRGDTWLPRARSTEMAALYHRQALRHGCAFFDTLAFLGGAGGIEAWVSAGLALDDHVHLTDPGYERLALALLRRLVPAGE